MQGRRPKTRLGGVTYSSNAEVRPCTAVRYSSRVYVADLGPESLKAPANTNFLLTGAFSTTDPGQVRVVDTQSGEPVGDTIDMGPGPTSLVFVPR